MHCDNKILSLCWEGHVHRNADIEIAIDPRQRRKIRCTSVLRPVNFLLVVGYANTVAFKGSATHAIFLVIVSAFGCARLRVIIIGRDGNFTSSWCGRDYRRLCLKNFEKRRRGSK